MDATDKAPGFYATDAETYYRTPQGRVWIVQSADDLGTQDPVEVLGIPDEATRVDAMLTPDEAIGHCRRVQAVSGERLIGD